MIVNFETMNIAISNGHWQHSSMKTISSETIDHFEITFQVQNGSGFNTAPDSEETFFKRQTKMVIQS